MPKVTFYNLPENKKVNLISAVNQEFSRVPLYDASISNIVKSAGIPRGSFYQYFEDKEDAYLFLLNEHAKENRHTFVSILNKKNGDLFDTMEECFALIIRDEENGSFMRNTFLNMTYKVERAFSESFSNHEVNENFKEMSSLIDKSNLNVLGDEELFHLMKIIIAVTSRNFIEKFAQELTVQEAVDNYKMEMRLLKNGLSRNK